MVDRVRSRKLKFGVEVAYICEIGIQKRVRSRPADVSVLIGPACAAPLVPVPPKEKRPLGTDGVAPLRPAKLADTVCDKATEAPRSEAHARTSQDE